LLSTNKRILSKRACLCERVQSIHLGIRFFGGPGQRSQRLTCRLLHGVVLNTGLNSSKTDTSNSATKSDHHRSSGSHTFGVTLHEPVEAAHNSGLLFSSSGCLSLGI